jgi:hypothetical protein
MSSEGLFVGSGPIYSSSDETGRKSTDFESTWFLQLPGLRAVSLCAVITVSICFSTPSLLAGTILRSLTIPSAPPVVSGPGLGVATIPGIFTFNANNDNSAGPSTFDNNIWGGHSRISALLLRIFSCQIDYRMYGLNPYPNSRKRSQDCGVIPLWI